MAITATLIYRGTLTTTTTTTLYTASSNTVVSNIALTNTTSSAATATIGLSTGGTSVALLSAVTIPANSTAFFDLKQYVANGQTVTGGAGTASAITAHISGVTGV
jgi:hypothetical protein